MLCAYEITVNFNNNCSSRCSMNRNTCIPDSRKKATVIGASGYVGQHVVKRLSRLGIDVKAPRRGSELQLLGTDLGELFYCAGMTSDYAANPLNTTQVHINLILSLLESCRYNSIVYLSSTRLYDRPSATDVCSELISENDSILMNTQNPRHLYDLTKAVGESLCLNMASEKASIARLACVWDTSDIATGFIPSLIRQLQEVRYKPSSEKCIFVNSTADVARHYIHINDLVSAIIDMAYKEGCDQIISLASESTPVKNSCIFSLLEKSYGIKILTQSDSLEIKSNSSQLLLTPSLDLSAYHRLIGKESVPPFFLDNLYSRLFK